MPKIFTMNSPSVSYVIGIDVGTTSVKGILMNQQGTVVESVKQEYALDTGAGGICELDAEVYWNVTCCIIKKMLKNPEVDPETITGIAFSGQGETFIPVGPDGKPLRKAIVWLDNRSAEEAAQIRDEFGSQRIMDVTGQPEVLPIWPATRILWLRKNEPQLFYRVHKYLLVEDFLMFRMTGKYCSEHSLVSSTLYFDISRKIWWNEMLGYLGITEDQLPQLFPSGRIMGNLTADASLATGLKPTTKCVTGAYDHPAGAIGSGNIHPGDVTLTIGASMAMCVALDKPVSDMTLKLPCQCHAIDGLYFLLPYGQTAGMVLKWFKDEFCRPEIEQADSDGGDPYDLVLKHAEKIAPGAEGLIMLPHLMGTGSPEFNPKATGVFEGVKMGMGRGHFIRAIIESVSLMVYHNLETMKKHGIVIKVIHVLGGASKSNLWNQILADVAGLPVVTLKNAETSVTGACLLAGVGTGVFKDIEAACKASVKTGAVFLPDDENHKVYQQVYKKYTQLYQFLKEFWNNRYE